MHKKTKIFNDPIYGLVEIPNGLIFQLLEHPFFQRLRRIKQLGLTDYVYPGAIHTRFHHAIGALHITGKAIEVLRSKGHEISSEEKESVQIAILLHDIGHGPFSHALEHTLSPYHHEDLSLMFMESLNVTFANQLEMAIDIFKGTYPKKFLHQLVSGQLDMDRMDYLKRDSFFTGVHEGVIGHERIIQMMDVVNDELVLEEKAIYSIEKFLIARRLMYWQVYLHKTVLAAEQMVIRLMRTAKKLVLSGEDLPCSEPLKYFLERDKKENFDDKRTLLNQFGSLDDYDVVMGMKNWVDHSNPVLSFLSKSLLHRKLFKIELGNEPIAEEKILQIQRKLEKVFDSQLVKGNLIFKGIESNTPYSMRNDEIQILLKNGEVRPLSEISEYGLEDKIITKHYLCYPKNIV